MYPQYSQARNWTFYESDPNRREPVIFGVVFCLADKIYAPFTGEQMTLSKETFGILLSVVDILVVLSTIILINVLEIRYRQYAKVFDKRNVEMRDFSV